MLHNRSTALFLSNKNEHYFAEMSGFDPLMLSSIGIEETLYDFPLPIYVHSQMTKYNDNGMSVYTAQPRPLSEVALIRLIFQIVDLPKFIRYLYSFYLLITL